MGGSARLLRKVGLDDQHLLARQVVLIELQREWGRAATQALVVEGAGVDRKAASSGNEQAVRKSASSCRVAKPPHAFAAIM